MNIYSILKEGLRGEGSDKMWCITKILSDSIEENVPDKQKEVLLGKVYYSINGGHFNKEFAEEVISNMYYMEPDGSKSYAPYWTDSELKPLYDSIKAKIPPYNFYDFVVTMNMVMSDNYKKLRRWFPDADDDEMLVKILEEAVNYLSDEDNPYGTEKVWKYLKS